MEIKNYHINQQIYKGPTSLVYRGISLESGLPVVIKKLKSEYPSQKSVDKFRNQFFIVKNLDLKGIIKPYNLIPYQNALILVMEDIGGNDLRRTTAGKKLPLFTFLNVAVKLAAALEEIHEHNIIHKDIKPDNIIVTSDYSQVRIIDFSIATKLTREKQDIISENLIEGTLAYVSPEQTGRMNRAVDYRTDLYSLGISLYELITGQLPFYADDALGMVHLHIACNPQSPGEIDRSIPDQVSNIIMHLIEKNPEERYRSARGLRKDLEICLESLVSTGEVASFFIGSDDFSNKFSISDKLYGRENETEILINGFNECAGGGRQMMVVAGLSGIGKSSLIHELYKPVVKHRGFFISGKFNQLGKNIPYSAVIDAFNDLIHQLLTRSEKELLVWRKAILEALGDNAKVIINVIPALEYITGKQPEIPELDPVRTQNRFKIYFQRFTSVFTRKKHPLTMFLDDLQWADLASLQLMRTLISDNDTESFFLIGAYRENEVTETHPVMVALEEIRQENIKCRTIFLSPLSVDEIAQLIRDSFESNTEKSLKLASIVFNKTEGNPFFIGEFLKSLHETGLLTFSRHSGWSWDIEKIRKLKVTDNVVELVAEKIKKMPAGTREVLTFASCIGRKFSIKRLAMVSKIAPEELKEHLMSCLEEGFIYPGENEYFFSHDKVQEAVYSLISPDVKIRTHYTIGNLVLEHSDEENLDKNIFYITDQLNSCTELIFEESERIKLASLNLKAGIKAKKSTAYEQALEYLQKGISLSADSWWDSQYDLLIALYSQAAEAAYLNVRFEYMEQIIALALVHTKELLDKVKLFEIKINSQASRGNHLGAIKTCRTILEELGYPIPARVSKIDGMIMLFKTNMLLKGKSMQDIRNLPRMTDPYKQAAIRLILSMATSAFFSNPSLSTVITYIMIRLSLQHGLSPLSAVPFTAFGMICCGILGKIERGFEIGNLAQDILDDFNAKELRARVSLLYNGMIKHWKVHLKQTIQPLKRGYFSGLEVGDLEYAFLNIQIYIMGKTLTDESRNSVYNEGIKYLEVARKFKQMKSTHSLQRLIQFNANLMGLNKNRESLKGDFFDEEQIKEESFKNKNSVELGGIYFFDLMLAYLFGNYKRAVNICFEGEKYIDTQVGMAPVPIKDFYFCLALLADYPVENRKKQKQYLKIVNKKLKKMRKWAGISPVNHLHRCYLIEAEKARVSGDDWKAAELYNKAVITAHEHEYIHEQAIGYECGAAFYISRGNSELGSIYLQKSRYFFERWGASGKVEQLEEKYPAYFFSETKNVQSSFIVTEDSTFSAPAMFDLHSMLKASQAISVEIEQEKLLRKMMEIVVENIGAQKGILILEDSGSYTIESEIVLETDTIKVLQSIRLEDFTSLPHGVINYVLRTGEIFVTPDAARDIKLEDNSYISDHAIKSLLCFPVKYQKKISALLYFENNAVVNVFTPGRLELLKTLSSQIAISLENARLYKTLKEQERLKQEMEIAEQIQTAILPDAPFHQELEISTVMKPADKVGGDYYDIFYDKKGALWLAIGDVSGHGVTPGLIMMMAQTSLISVIHEHDELTPSQALVSVNKVLYDNLNKRIQDEHFMSMNYLKYLGEGRFLQAGAHLDIIIFKKSSGTCYSIPTEGTFMGFIPDISEATKDSNLHLERGDVMLLYTDGIIESRHETTGKLFEMERLMNIVARNGNYSLDKIKSEILQQTLSWCGYIQKDDISMILVRRK